MKTIKLLTIALIVSLFLSACHSNTSDETTKDEYMGNEETSAEATNTNAKKGITQKDWGTSDGKQVHLFTLTNANGVQVSISDYGGTITSFIAPDKNGNKQSIVLGFNNLDGYLAHPPYFGATVGRYGNRIAKGKFTLNGQNYTLATNDGKNHLHGGTKGFDKVVWTAGSLNANNPQLSLSYLSKDNEEGYPGNLNTTVTFTLTDDNALRIDYHATTDKATPINLTNHSYFNLSGSLSNTILNDWLRIDADRYTPVDSTLIPTGQLAPVKGTPFDFTTPHQIGERIAQVPGGYDHNFVLNKKDTSLTLAAEVTDSSSGRKLQVYTTQPGIQFYTGNFLNGSIKTDNGEPINQHTAFCLETQHFPNSPNTPAFPSSILQPGQNYHYVTEYKVSTLK
jgi:aldose 1-epimerase